MEENQTNQNLNQQPVQPNQVAQQPEQQVQQWQSGQQQPVQQQNVDQASVSMQIQQLLVQQQQYQKQYNELVDYVKKTPGLPIDQVNQIKQQLDQLNALFVEWKQQLQALWYTQVQVNKPTEVKTWAKINLSFKKLAIWCGLIVVLLLAGLFAALFSLQSNPEALLGLGIDTGTAKGLLQGFFGLLLWSVIILMVWVIVSNIYRLITVKNQSKGRFVLWLIWGIFWASVVWVSLWLIFWEINKIVTEVKQVEYDIVQPYLVWRVNVVWEDEFLHPYRSDDIKWIGTEYRLIAPSEMAFSFRWDEFQKFINKRLPSNIEIQAITLSCNNWEGKILEWTTKQTKEWWYTFEWTCLYSKVWKYQYSLNITYDNMISKEKKTETFKMDTLNFESEIIVYKTSTTSSSSNNKTSRLVWSNWEFIIWRAPAKITIDTTQVFRDFSLWTYEVEWDMDWDFESDRVDQVKFDYSYKVPKVYYVTYKFPWLSDDTLYRFPVRVEQSDRPVCGIEVERFVWTKKYQISTDFIDASSAATIASYNYTIWNKNTNKAQEELRNESQSIVYEFPEKWNFVVILDYVTVDWKQWQCESELIQMEKEKFNVSYTILAKESDSWKFKELCNSKGSSYSKCRQINLEVVPKTYQLQIKSITPNSNTTKKAVFLNEKPILNDNDTYLFEIPDEWTYYVTIVTSDEARWMDEETIEIKFVADKPDIVGNMTVTDPENRKPLSEWFEPLTVILDASKTEINVPWDEIVYFTWDFGDGETKINQQNWVVAHTYNYDYVKENWIFQPKVTVKTLKWNTDVVYGPTLNIKKWLLNVDLSSTSHPSRQAPAWTEVSFSAEFDWLPEKMIWDFGDGSAATTCKWRNCTDITHTFKEAWLYSIKLSLEFDAVQQIDGTMDFKVF